MLVSTVALSLAAVVVSVPPAEPPKREWLLHLAPGLVLAPYIVEPYGPPAGPSLRIGGHAVRWGGRHLRFFLGGGPTLESGFFFFQSEAANQTSIVGDLLLGGGRRGEWAAYGQMSLGAGVYVSRPVGFFTAFPGLRFAVGAGGFRKVTEKVSVGGLLSAGYIGLPFSGVGGGIDLNASVVVNCHFGRKGDPL